jgi:hypothetical protein
MMDEDYEDDEEALMDEEEDPDHYGEDPLDAAMRDYDDDEDIRDHAFADPGGNSALRAASRNNPRNLPCPNCKEPNRLTPADRAKGYQCDQCANELEMGF